MIEMVTARRGTPRAWPQGVRGGEAAAADRERCRGGPILRGACSLKGAAEGVWTRLILAFARRPVLDFVTVPRCTATARPRRDPGPHHPHQELAADRGGARATRTRCFRRTRRLRSRTSLESIRAIRGEQRARRRDASSHHRSPAPRRARTRARTIRAWPFGERRGDRRRHRRNWIDTITDAEAPATTPRSLKPTCFDMEYWPPNSRSRAARAEAPRGSDRCGHRRGRRIGAATARAFAAAGAEVAAARPQIWRRQPSRPRLLGGVAVQCDVTHAASVNAAFDHVVAAFGGLDILVSNAARRPPQGRLAMSTSRSSRKASN